MDCGSPDTQGSTDIATTGQTAVAAQTVGIFDSGIGGFTVAKALLERRPDLNLVYYGDSINIPYGGRPPSQLARFARHNIEFLLDRGIDILAVGCNASNSVLGQGDLKSFGLPVYDLVTSTTEWLKELSDPPAEILLVATEATINSRYWQRKLSEVIPGADIIDIAAHDFVPLVEAQEFDTTAIRESMKRNIGPYIRDTQQTIIHGCTHYPLLQEYMAELSPVLSFIDPAVCLAEKLTSQLLPRLPDSEPGKLRFYSSLPGETFYRTGERALGRSIRELTSMYIVNPYED